MANVDANRRSYLPDYVVLLAMAIVAATVGVGLIAQFGYTWPLAGMVAGLAFAAAATGHILLRRSESVARLRAELARREAARGQREDIGVSPAEGPREAPVQAPVPPLGEYRPTQVAEPVAPQAEPAAARVEPVVAQVEAETEEAVSEGLARLKIGAAAQQGTVASKVRANAGRSDEIGGIIKRLADDIAAGRRGQEGVAIDRVLTPKPITAEHFSTPGNMPQPVLPTSTQAQPPFEAEAPLDAADKLAAVANALAAEQVDVFLEPIHGLSDGQPRHYEVTIRLALGDGEVLDHDAYSAATRGTTLLPLIDAVKVSHSKKIGLQLMRRGQSGALISQINGQSVSGPEFGDDLATIMGPDRMMAGRLVLSFEQHDLRGFSPAQWQSLDRLVALGFRFALSDVTDMDMDFEMLGQKGFAFAKLDADIFREGLRSGQSLIPPTDVCRHLASAGLTLVVDHLQSDRDRAEVLGFGALFGQGVLFGGPRPVKAHVLKAPLAGAPAVAAAAR